MTDTLTALASENLNPSLRGLLEDVQAGHIRVPRFQRPFVWKDDQRLQLLESIRDNMPIGSLLVWSTSQFELASFPKVGPHSIPAVAGGVPLRGRQYLLDGHQRVSTLLGVLLAPVDLKDSKQEDDEYENIDWNIQYDLMDQDFIFACSTSEKKFDRPLLPLSTLLDGRLVNRHMRTLRANAASLNWAEESIEIWEERADQLSYRFQQYRIPIVVMVTDDLNLAARTFQRINSQGTPMGEAHLVAALTWTDKFDLREKLSTIREDFPLGWREIEDRIFLQVCKGLIDSDISKVDENQLIDGLRQDNNLLDSAASGIRRAISLLSSKCGVVRLDLLPYATQLVFLAIEFARRGSKPIPEAEFVSWFWRTGWAEVFGGASFRQLRSEQDILRNLSINSVPNDVWKGNWIIPKRFDSRYARIRVWMLRMAANPALVDEQGIVFDGERLIRMFGKDAFVKLMPTPAAASTKLRPLLQTIGNRFLVDPSKAYLMRKALLEKQNLPIQFLNAHFISPSSLAALRSGNLEEFIQQRNAALSRWDLGAWNSERKGQRDI